MTEFIIWLEGMTSCPGLGVGCVRVNTSLAVHLLMGQKLEFGGKYDTSYDQAHEPRTRLADGVEPVVCSRCGVITAQPRREAPHLSTLGTPVELEIIFEVAGAE